MPKILKKIVQPRSLTDCSLDSSLTGRLKNHIWRMGKNAECIKTYTQLADSLSIEDSVVASLRRDGICISNTDTMLSEDGQAHYLSCREQAKQIVASEDVQNILAQRKNTAQGKDYLVHVVDMKETTPSDSPFLRLALDENILGTVAEYLGMMPQLHAIGAWLNFPADKGAKASQLWHRDPEDLHTVKVFVYLDDVGSEQGPFSYIKQTQPLGALSDKEPNHAHPRRVLDEEMDKTFPRDSWTSCTGDKGTMIIADTVGFHKGGLVRDGHRFLITFTYTSGMPQKERWLKVDGLLDFTLSQAQKIALS